MTDKTVMVFADLQEEMLFFFSLAGMGNSTEVYRHRAIK